MSDNSYLRTKKGLINSLTATCLQLVAILVGFFSRKIFLDYLGTEILGLNTTSQSLLGFLNLAELGIGSAIAVTLYKPLYEKDEKTIREIVALQGWLYKIIACIIIVASIVLMFFFPNIFSKSDLPLSYAYLSFGVMLFSSLLGYFVNYKQIVLSANQDDYKIQLTWKVVSIIKLVFQAVAVKYCKNNPFLWWVGLEALFTILSAVALNLMIYKSAPYLRLKVIGAKSLRVKYPQVVTKVKQLFVHKMGNYAIGQMTPLIIYAYATLSLVGLYGNYMVLITNLGVLLASAFTGLTAGIGSVVAEGNKALMRKIYREIFTLRYYLVAVSAICLATLSQPFVTIWLGAQYLLDYPTLLLMVMLFFCMNAKNVSQYFLSAYGLFQDIWTPIAEAILAVLGSIVLGKFYGLNGILLGSIISQVLVHFLWKPYFLFTQGFNEPVWEYIKIFSKHIVLILVCSALSFGLSTLLNTDSCNTLLGFLKYATIIFLFVSITLGGMLLLFEKGSRTLIQRMFNIIKH